MRKKNERRMEAALEPQGPGSRSPRPRSFEMSLCNYCTNALHKGYMDPPIRARSVSREISRQSLVEGKDRPSSRSSCGPATKDWEKKKAKEGELYQQIIDIPEEHGTKADRLIR